MYLLNYLNNLIIGKKMGFQLNSKSRNGMEFQNVNPI